MLRAAVFLAALTVATTAGAQSTQVPSAAQQQAALAQAAYLSALAAAAAYSGSGPAPSQEELNRQAAQAAQYMTNGAQALAIPDSGPGAAYFTQGAELYTTVVPSSTATVAPAPTAAPSASTSAPAAPEASSAQTEAPASPPFQPPPVPDAAVPDAGPDAEPLDGGSVPVSAAVAQPPPAALPPPTWRFPTWWTDESTEPSPAADREARKERGAGWLVPAVGGLVAGALLALASMLGLRSLRRGAVTPARSSR